MLMARVKGTKRIAYPEWLAPFVFTEEEMKQVEYIEEN